MYFEASIKLHFPKSSCQSIVETTNKVSSTIDKRFHVEALSDPSFIGSLKSPPMKKEATPKNTKGHIQKRPPMKKEETPKNAKRLIQKTYDKKGGNFEKRQRGSFKKDL
jgi:hypothetical protein